MPHKKKTTHTQVKQLPQSLLCNIKMVSTILGLHVEST